MAKPHVVDFGLALREENVGKGPKYAGTPAYMSPEQARGEGHRVDGRSDIFSLGVVFYELLVGRPPFRGETQVELLEQITAQEPRPPRQCDDTIPKELERICLKALSKRATERYTTAHDLAEDLRHFLSEAPQVAFAVQTPSRPSTDKQATQRNACWKPRVRRNAHVRQPAIKIVPKGLRSFDAQDADFFLELLPGPRDRDGLPDSIRFWKTRIEQTDPDETFRCGLIYGPSGCGKSSLVKAGLLPRLAEHVSAGVCRGDCRRDGNATAARAPQALSRLAEQIWTSKKRWRRCDVDKAFPGHKGADRPRPVRAMAARQAGRRKHGIGSSPSSMRRRAGAVHRDGAGRFLDGGQPVHARIGNRSCRRPQHCLPISSTRIMRRRCWPPLGVRSANCPENPRETSQEQKQFLEQAVNGLAQDGKVVCVRLALFAEMMKGKPWTPAALKEVGGTEGIGVTFLEETFSATTAPPEHRYHQKAARAVLKALLPDRHRHQGQHAVLLGIAGSVGIFRPPQGLRRSDPHFGQ